VTVSNDEKGRNDGTSQHNKGRWRSIEILRDVKMPCKATGVVWSDADAHGPLSQLQKEKAGFVQQTHI
jgi:hypothetical protein